jgi:pyruvate dehydrogenase E2 component (dihydrolipoamide acetyltransferase)
MRKTIAKRLSESMFGSPHYYVTVEIDMDAAVDLREQIQRLEEGKVSFNDLVVKACAKALTRFPMVNASWGGDKIATHAEVHIGIAVAIPDGLITPVVRNADRKSILEIAQEVRDLAARARDRKLKPEEFSGSTFTISNLGMYDVDSFTAIINPPDSAILAVGAVRKVPVVDGDDHPARAPDEGDDELRSPRDRRRAGRPVPGRGAAAAGGPGRAAAGLET